MQMAIEPRLQPAAKLSLHLLAMVRNKRTKGAPHHKSPPVESARLQALERVLLAHHHPAGDPHCVDVPVRILVDPHPRLLAILHLGWVYPPKC